MSTHIYRYRIRSRAIFRLYSYFTMSDWNGSCSDERLLSTNSTSHHWLVSEDEDFVIRLIQIITFICLVIGFFWNALVAGILLKEKLYKNPTYLILLNLTIVDILCCLLALLVYVVFIGASEFIFGDSDLVRCHFCRLRVMVGLTLNLVSFSYLAMMSMDRFVYLKYPLKYFKIVNVKVVIVSLAASWAVSLLATFPLLVNFGVVRNFRTLFCWIDIPMSGDYAALYLTVSGPMFIFIIIANILSLRIAWRKIKVRTDINSNHRQPPGNHTETANSSEGCKVQYQQYKDQVGVSIVFGGVVAATTVFWVAITIMVIAAYSVGEDKLEHLTAGIILLEYTLPIVHSLIETCLIPKGRRSVQNTLTLIIKGKIKLKLPLNPN